MNAKKKKEKKNEIEKGEKRKLNEIKKKQNHK
jgi:hypothetical protein